MLTESLASVMPHAALGGHGVPAVRRQNNPKLFLDSRASRHRLWEPLHGFCSGPQLGDTAHATHHNPSGESNSQGSDKGCGKDRRSPHSTGSPTSCQAIFSAQHPVKCLKVALLWDLHLNAIALSKKTTLLTQGTSCERVLPHPRAKGCRHLRHR